ncbi:MAG: beta-lactamase family protein, partial [Chloroflexi bacterium]|nr:beta-lactamase family protein [Chloroflexota bacterium]
MQLERTERLIREGIERGLHIGAQLYVSLAGKGALRLSLGDSGRGTPMKDETLTLWLSSIKPIAAVAIAQLWERGSIGLEDPVAKYVPEFGANGKDVITLRQIMTHTAGFRAPIRHWRGQTWEEAVAEVCKAKIEPRWIPGKKAGYHPASSWYVLGELVRKIDGRPFGRYVREAIFEPLGMTDWWIGLPLEKQQSYGGLLGVLYDTSQTPPVRDETFNSAEFIAAVRPGANGRGPAYEFGRFYEMLLNGGQLDGARILIPQTVAAITARQRTGMFDHTFKHVLDTGLGFIVDSKQYGADTVPYGYGDHASA